MPASKEYIKALQIKRLEQSRPKVKLPTTDKPLPFNKILKFIILLALRGIVF